MAEVTATATNASPEAPGGKPGSGSSSKLRNAFMGVWTAVGVILLTGVAVYLLNILSLPVSILIWTAVFVFCLRGMVNKLERRGVNRVLGTRWPMWPCS